MNSPVKLRSFGRALVAGMVWLLASCGGGGGSSAEAPAPAVSTPPVTGSNVQTLRVGPGPAGMSVRVVNLLYTSVRLCVPGTTTCQTIDHVLVDTGSTGLRLLGSAVTLPLTAAKVADQPLYNCVQFIDQTHMWGPVVSADVYLGGSALDGEKAANLRVQLAGATGSPAAPSECAVSGSTAIDSVNALGANGILGVGMAAQDCGQGCVDNPDNRYYHALNGNTTTPIALSLSEQLQHPVSQFAVNNNGVVISLPAVAATGAGSATGTLIFGIGTQANNTPGTVSKMVPNTNGYFTTTFNSRTLVKGFVDSGSNGWFFGSDTQPAFPTCTNAPQWYCPTGTQALHAVNSSGTETSTVNFSIANAVTLFSNPATYALSNLGGPIGDDSAFDFGLPFFYGRQVFTAIQGRSTTPQLGTGPYVAY